MLRRSSGRARLAALMKDVPFRIPTTVLGLCGPEAYAACGGSVPARECFLSPLSIVTQPRQCHTATLPHCLQLAATHPGLLNLLFVVGHDGREYLLGPPPVACGRDLRELLKASFRANHRHAAEWETPLDAAFEGLRRLATLESDLEEMVKVRRQRDKYREQVQHRVGQVLAHRKYGYRGVIVGWDGRCRRSAEWLAANNLPQNYIDMPFYYVLPDQADCQRLFKGPRESKYVAQENLVIRRAPLLAPHVVSAK